MEVFVVCTTVMQPALEDILKAENIIVDGSEVKDAQTWVGGYMG